MNKYFEQLSDVKVEFQNNLQDKKEHSLSKGLLENFAKTFSEHKGLLLAMSAVSLLGNFKNINFEKVTPETSMHQEFDLSGYKDYKEGLEISNNFTNVNYKANIKKLDIDSIHTILDQKENSKDYVFTNPYTEKNIITLKIEKEDPNGSHTVLNDGKPVPLNLTNSLLMMDHSKHDIIIDTSQLKSIKNLGFSSSQETINSYVVMHEIAHTTFRQSPAYDSKYSLQDRETHADLSSIIFVSKHSANPLKTFNELSDDILHFRYMGLTLDDKSSDITHNSVYPVLELKNAINNNPQLLNMKDTSITEFSHKLTENLSKKDYSFMTDSYFKKSGIELSEDSILKDLRSNEPSSLVRRGVDKIFDSGNSTEKVTKLIQGSPESRANKIAQRIKSDLDGPQTYTNMIENIFLSSKKEDFKNIVDNLYKDVQKNSNLDSSFINTVKQDIYFDSLDFSSNIKDTRLENLTNSANSYLTNKI